MKSERTNAHAWIIAACVLLTLAVSARAQTSGGETRQSSSEWTVDTLKEHFDDLRAADKTILSLHEKITDLQFAHAAAMRAEAAKASEQRFQAQEKAQDAYKAMANEFRGSLSDSNNRFISRAEMGGYAGGFLMVMGVLAAWIGLGRRNREMKPPWVDELIKAVSKP
jgi:hypothetical protein